MDWKRPQGLSRTLARAATHAAQGAMGRTNLARFARFLTNQVRLDVPNSMASNGERMVQEVVLSHARGPVPQILDVGANAGEWVAQLADVARAVGCSRVDAICFEPAPTTYQILSSRMPMLRPVVEAEAMQAAVSDRAGRVTLHLVSEASGANSLLPRRELAEQSVHQIDAVTLDSFCSLRGIMHVSLLKVDTEGHDLSVLRGARGLFERKAIDVAQFEYNWRWIDARSFLRDGFDLADAVGYRLGKVTPGGIEFYERWDPELESFREGNYLLCEPTAASWFRSIRWWKG